MDYCMQISSTVRIHNLSGNTTSWYDFRSLSPVDPECSTRFAELARYSRHITRERCERGFAKINNLPSGITFLPVTLSVFCEKKTFPEGTLFFSNIYPALSYRILHAVFCSVGNISAIKSSTHNRRKLC